MHKATDVKVARFVFERWDDAELKKKYMSDPSWFNIEIRREPDCPEIFRWILSMAFTGDQPTHSEFEGMTLEVAYYEDSTTPEEIEKLFTEYKIRTHRAEPFIVHDENTYNISTIEANTFIRQMKTLMKELKKRFPES